jgi:hypothetical protein
MRSPATITAPVQSEVGQHAARQGEQDLRRLHAIPTTASADGVFDRSYTCQAIAM